MKNERTQAWADALRNTTKKQGKEHLYVRRVADGDGNTEDFFCCLGIGCLLAGIPSTSRDLYETTLAEGDDQVGQISTVFTFHAQDAMPPPEFAKWLGFTMQQITNAAGEHPTDIGLRLPFSGSAPYVEEDRALYSEEDLEYASLAFDTLNDTRGLPFEKIGDLIAKYGVELVGA